MSRDPVDPGVDLCIIQFLEEGTVETTWPWVHPHGCRLLMERMNPVAEKGSRPSAPPTVIVEQSRARIVAC
jgi:hypothetical protein